MIRQIVVPLNTAHTNCITLRHIKQLCIHADFVTSLQTWVHVQVPTLEHKRLTKIERC